MFLFPTRCLFNAMINAIFTGGVNHGVICISLTSINIVNYSQYGNVYLFISYFLTYYELLSIVLLDGFQLPCRLDGIRRAFLNPVAGAAVS